MPEWGNEERIHLGCNAQCAQQIAITADNKAVKLQDPTILARHDAQGAQVQGTACRLSKLGRMSVRPRWECLVAEVMLVHKLMLEAETLDLRLLYNGLHQS